MKALITGGSGFVGRHLAKALVAQGCGLVNLDLARPRHEPPFVRTIVGDVRDPRAVREAIRGCSLVVHLAAAHHDHGLADDTYYDVNEGGARVLVAAMAEADVRRVLFVSSVAVYGDGDGDGEGEPDEGCVPRPASPYGASKLLAEGVFRAWARARPGRSATVLRPTVIFGEHHFANMYALIRAIESGRYLQVGAGRNRKSLAYVANFVDAALFLLARDQRPAWDLYNYVDKPDLRSGEIAAAIYAALGRESSRLRVPLPVALALAAPIDAVAALTGRNLPVSRKRIRKLAEAETRYGAPRIGAAGFVPRYTLHDGLAEMVRWYVAEGRRLEPMTVLPPAQPALATPGIGLQH